MKRFLCLRLLPFLSAVLLPWACTQKSAPTAETAQASVAGTKTVELRKENGSYKLYRHGAPYFIKGAGGSRYLEQLASYGGNSIRTWSTQNAQQVLNNAHQHGLTVTMGLDVARERHGFDYNNPEAVAKQLATLRQEVLKYKDHPALLVWGIGNELNLSYSNPKVWDAVQEIARMIQEVDPNHPTTTMLAGLNQKEVDYLKAKAPALDFISINAYGELPEIPHRVRQFGWEGAYMITEWGPTGHWEGPQTPWKAAVEETSAEKAAVYRSRYEATMLQDTTRCLGSYVFLWGQKQERTPTWYGLFTEQGHESEVVDAMHYLWKGTWPQNRAPHLQHLHLNGKKATDNIYVQAKQTYLVHAAVTDPDQDALTYRYELLPESTDLKEGGDPEQRPGTIPNLLFDQGKGQATLTSPAQAGAYRLFVYVYDGHNNVATANIHFFVR